MKFDDLVDDGYYWRIDPENVASIIELRAGEVVTPSSVGADEIASYFGPLQPPSFDAEPVTSQGDVLRVIDATNADQLVCRRAECFFSPNTDRSPSANARIIFHTEWWAYSGDMFRGATLGPQIEVDLAEVLPLQFDVGMGVPVPTRAIVQGIILAFEQRARDRLSPPAQLPEMFGNFAPPE